MATSHNANVVEFMPPGSDEVYERHEERIVSNVVMAGREVYNEVKFLKPNDFYFTRYRVTWKAIQYLAESDMSIDFMTLYDVLKEMEWLQELNVVDAKSYVRNLPGKILNSDSLVSSARKVQQAGMCRDILQRDLPRIAGAAGNGDLAEVMTLLTAALNDTMTAMAETSELEHLKEVLPTYMDKLTSLQRSQQGQITGVPTGLSGLDMLTGGLQKSDVVILAARPSMGKSSAANTVARNAAMQGKVVALFSLEMSKQQVVQRFLAMQAGVDQQRLHTGQIEDDEWERINYGMEQLNQIPIFIDDTAGISPLEIKNKVKRLIASGTTPDLIIVDYIQLMRSSGGKKTENRVLEIGEISRELKSLARELNVPVLALAQLSRAVEQRQSKIPQLSDLRESGSIENDADLVIFIYREDVYNPESSRPNQADFIIAKHRNGPVGEVATYFHKSHTCFRDLTLTDSEKKYVSSVPDEEEDY
jgi:replicative DNA helicase